MDLRLDERGRLAVKNGQIDIVTDKTELIKHYLRAAIYTELTEDDIPTVTFTQLNNIESAAIFKSELQANIINVIERSSFSKDFVSTYIQVNFEIVDNADIKLYITYYPPGNELIEDTFTFKKEGGTIYLNDKLYRTHNVLYDQKLIAEEIIIEEPSSEIAVTMEPISDYAYLTENIPTVINKDVYIQSLTTLPSSSFRNDNISILGIVLPESNEFTPDLIKTFHTNSNMISLKSSEFIRKVKPDYKNIKDNIMKAFFLRSLIPNVKSPLISVITDNIGTIEQIYYIPELNDYVCIIFKEKDEISLTITYIEVLAYSSTYEFVGNYIDGKETYSSPIEDSCGSKVFKMSKVISEGVYNIYYTGKVKQKYNASLETTYGN